MKHHAQKQPKILKLCLRASYNSGIILSKMFTNYSQNYAGIIGAGLSLIKMQISHVLHFNYVTATLLPLETPVYTLLDAPLLT